MDTLKIFIFNLTTIPIISFVFGVFLSILPFKFPFNKKIYLFLTFFLLFSIGLKGGGSLLHHSGHKVFFMLGLLVVWGFVQPLVSYWILRRFTKTDSTTAAAISACFGSVSVMTYVAATTFLEKLDVQYEGSVLAALAIMEVPAIISGLLIAKKVNKSKDHSIKSLWIHAIFNKSILMIFAGMFFGGVCYLFEWSAPVTKIGFFFKPCLSLFLLNMGWLVGSQREHLRDFSWSLSLFGFYMPLMGAFFGILLSYFFNFNVGTGTLITVLCASASYIAVPAVMKIAIPEAKEGVYLSLSLGIAFPFNVVIGIPIYYQLALRVLN
jgi:hypothetical protein